MFICFVGIDGSGKTLQAEMLVKRLRADGVPCEYAWCRYSPKLLLPLVRFGKMLIRRKKGGSEYSGFTSSKQGMLKKPVLGPLWLNASLLEYRAQVNRTIGSILRRGENLICDRYFYDMLADLSISLDKMGDGVLDLARHPLIVGLPLPDRVFFLDVPAEVAFSRKDDPNVMGKQYLVDRADIYSRLSDGMGFTRIDGTMSIEEIADYVYDETIALINGREREAVK